MSTEQTGEEGTTSTITSGGGHPPRLNRLNWLNAVAYALNFVITYGVGTMGWLGNGTNAELSAKYQTLVTPNATAFSIWAVIFVSQAIFCIWQLFPRFRGKPMVQQGVGYYYSLTCLFQVCWTLFFAYEVIWLSLCFMLLIWASLLTILVSQYNISSSEGTNSTLVEFWLLRFPFAIHCGWVTAASALNINVLVVAKSAPADVQLAVGIVSLAVLHAISVWVIFGVKRPNYTLACVLAWANWWIHVELNNETKDKIVTTFSSDTIAGVGYAAAAVAVIILVQIAVRVVGRAVLEQLFQQDKHPSSSSSVLVGQNSENTNAPDDCGGREGPSSAISADDDIATVSSEDAPDARV